MRATGIIRHVDNLGRVVLPKGLRKTFGIEYGDGMEVYVDGDTIILQKHVPGCEFCAETVDLVDFGNVKVCCNCIHDMYDKMCEVYKTTNVETTNV